MKIYKKNVDDMVTHGISFGPRYYVQYRKDGKLNRIMVNLPFSIYKEWKV